MAVSRAFLISCPWNNDLRFSRKRVDMRSIKIVTDSTCDLTPEMCAFYQITMVPLNVCFGEQSFKDKVDLDAEKFYTLLKTSPHHPRTSQPSPEDFKKTYTKLLADDGDIISIHLSAKMSGTLQSAELAKKELKSDKIQVIDSEFVSLSLGLIVIECAKARDNGKTVMEILALVEKLKKEIKIYFIVDNLEYLQKGGRIGKAQAMIGGLLNIRPVLTVSDGVVACFEKLRGVNKAVGRLEVLFNDYLHKHKQDRVRLGLAHAAYGEGLNQLKNKISDYYDPAKAIISAVGPVVGAHVGPGTLAVTFCEMPAEE